MCGTRPSVLPENCGHTRACLASRHSVGTRHLRNSLLSSEISIHCAQSALRRQETALPGSGRTVTQLQTFVARPRIFVAQIQKGLAAACLPRRGAEPRQSASRLLTHYDGVFAWHGPRRRPSTPARRRPLDRDPREPDQVIPASRSGCLFAPHARSGGGRFPGDAGARRICTRRICTRQLRRATAWQRFL